MKTARVVHAGPDVAQIAVAGWVEDKGRREAPDSGQDPPLVADKGGGVLESPSGRIVIAIESAETTRRSTLTLLLA